MDTPMIIGFSSILLAGLADIVLTTRWNRAYYTLGLPIFIRRIHKPGGIAELPLADLEKSSVTAAGPPLLFKRLDNDVIAFREKVFAGALHYIPIMHGAIRYDAAEGVARVTGIVNWFVIAFIACFAFLMGKNFVELLPIIAGVYGIIYFIQAVRFNRVAKKLRTELPSPS